VLCFKNITTLYIYCKKEVLMLKGFKRNFKPLEVLTEEQVSDIWRGVFEVLEKTGLKFDVETPEALDILDGGGCKVDYEEKMVRYPPGLVEKLIQQCPGSFPVEARDPKDSFIIDGDTTYVMPGPGMWYWDFDKLEPRYPTRKEYIDAVKVFDALPNLHFHHSNAPNTNIADVHPVMSTIETYAARARYSTKAQTLGPSLDNVRFNLEIARVVGARGMGGAGAASPLSWGNTEINNTIILEVKAGLPIIALGGSVWGGTAPATIAGELVTNIAESIGPLSLAQLINPGHPILPGSFTFPQNMRTGAPAFANITTGLAGMALCQCWRRYRLPVFLLESSIPNSKVWDYQAGYEKGMLSLAHALGGAAVIWIHGTVHGELTAHPLQAIMDDEISGMIGRCLEGTEVTDETLAVELIKEVGPNPGMYLDKEHTRNWWRRSQYIANAADDSTLQDWLRSGKKTALDHAKERMEEILDTHEVSVPLTPHQEEEIDRILSDARNYYKPKMEL
jgi:trimethylamine--corrinoid protein Co-methyltransferase